MKHSELRHQPRHVNPRIQVIRFQLHTMLHKVLAIIIIQHIQVQVSVMCALELKTTIILLELTLLVDIGMKRLIK